MKYIKSFDKFFESLSNQTIISVDIQPEYLNGITFEINDWTNYINSMSENNRIVFLYNGPEVGGLTEDEYKYWLEEEGMDLSTIDDALFYDKGYAFFRSCMGRIDHDNIVDLVRYMYRNDIRDSRDLTSDIWDEITDDTNTDLREFLEENEDCVFIPELMDVLKPYNNIIVMGGGLEECLKEVEIALDALNKPHQIEHKYTY